ncbi:MAG TPA: fimbria/pilus periplasmic chaperone [Anaeromyxobacteraceae bacterium]|nr:fimbria/pilus periplasmic chaperone [Anaeromyxobacteraceae bacterium]
MHRACLAAALLALATTGAARAGQLDISPIVMELSPESPSALLSLRNVGEPAARFQVRIFVWAQTPEGKMDLAPTRDVAAYPPLLEIPAGEERKIRIGAKDARPGPRERSYRLLLEEMPRGDAPPAGQVRVLTRISVPIFLRPQTAVAKSEIRIAEGHAGRFRAALRNLGTVHVRPQSVRVVARDAARKVVGEQDLQAWYVLAGDERVYDVELPASACPAARTATITAAYELGAVEATANDVCAP